MSHQHELEQQRIISQRQDAENKRQAAIRQQRDEETKAEEQRTARELTDRVKREQEVAELVEKGLRNRDIARNLGIQTGTVKIHLKHIFEKTGVRGRYGLALSGLREKGTISLPPAF